MKLLFVHDFPVEFNQTTKKYYSTGFPSQIWQRYLSVFDEISVSSRIKLSLDNDENSLSSGKNIHFKPIKEYKNLLSFITSYNLIKKQLTENIKDADGVLIRLPSVLGFMAARICVELNKPYTVEVVGSMFKSYWYYGGVLSKLLALPSEIIQKNYVKKASVAIYITNEYLQKLYPTNGLKFSQVSNVEIENYNDNEIITNKLDKNETIKIGMVGSTYVKYKGHKLALKMIKKLKISGYNILFEVVGQGPSKMFLNDVKSLGLEENVEFIGRIENAKQMKMWYKSLNFYIQPSKTEGHGRAVVEAISNRLPVFTSKAGGLRESISEEYLFDYGDLSTFSSLLEKAIENDEFRLENINKNYKNIANNKKEIVTKKRKEALTTYKNLLKELYGK